MEPAENGRGRIGGYADKAVAKEEIRKYLDVAARFPQMPWYNILLILKQMPEAEILCGIRAWRKYGAVLRRGEEPVMLLSPVAAGYGGIGSGIPDGPSSGISGSEICGSSMDSRIPGGVEADGNGTGQGPGMGAVRVYDIAQVKLQAHVPALKMPGLDAGVEDALRGRCGLVVMEDRGGGFLRSRALKSCVSCGEKSVYIRPGLPDAVRDVELMKCYAKYKTERTAGDAESAEGLAAYGMMEEYRDLAGDCLAYLLCKYFQLPEYPLRVVPSGLFGETAERKGLFLCGLSEVFFGAVKELAGKKMLSFNETMFCNLFFTEPDRGRILENLGRFMESRETVDGMVISGLLAFQRDISKKEIFSDREIKEIYEKRLARGLFSFPPVIYRG